MEYFTRMLPELQHRRDFKYHHKCKAINLSHLCFADDLMLCCRADSSSPLILKEYVDRSANTSGLKVNLSKNQLFFCGVDHKLKSQLLRQLGFSEGRLPIKYLGLPLIATKLTSEDCKPIIEKIQKRISSWSAKTLTTYAGSLMLIKSVLFHFQVYWSNAMLMPSSIIKQIEALCKNYLWSGTSDRQKVPLVAWDTLCLPRNEGGVGLI